MPRYHLSPLAEQDLEDIWLYTCDRWSLQQADDYHAGFVAAFEQIAAGQRHGQPVYIRSNYLKYRVGSHAIFYRHTTDRVDIIRILHGRMDTERHLPSE